MDSNHDDKREIVGVTLGKAYALMSKILGNLDLPIMLPAPTAGALVEVKQAVINARDLTAELPLDVKAAAMLDTMILEWLTALELGVLDRLEPADWALDAAMDALLRLPHIAAQLIEHLDLGNEN